MFQYYFQDADRKLILKVWNKGALIPGLAPIQWCRDVFGFCLYFPEYRNTDSDCGWEIDHIKPLSNGGSDDIVNLQPLYWRNNRTKGNRYP